VKGKVTDSWNNGLPIVTTYYGGESCLGIDYKSSDDINTYTGLANSYANFIESNNEIFGGFITNDKSTFIKHCYDLYNDKDVWTNKANIGRNILNNKFSYKVNSERLLQINRISEPVHSRVLSKVLQSETLRSTKYMAKYIEYKNNLI
jgi:hypothetical protein